MLLPIARRLCTAALLLVGLASCGGGESVATKQGMAQGMRAAAATSDFDYGPAVQQLYIGYFGRPADPAALVQFKAQLAQYGAPPDIVSLNKAYDENAGVRILVDSFANSEESKLIYLPGAPSIDFVRAIYLNALGRLPETTDPGLAFWTNAIDHKVLTRTKAALSILAGAQQNQTAQGLVDAKTIGNKATVAQLFTARVPAQVYRGDVPGRMARILIFNVNSEDIPEAVYQARIDDLLEDLSRLAYFPAFAGTYQGTLSGGDEGSFTITIAADGKVSGSGQTSRLGQQTVFGQLKKPDGQSATMLGNLASYPFSGTITWDGKFTGTWTGHDTQGSISASRK